MGQKTGRTVEAVGRKEGRQYNRLKPLDLEKLPAPGFYADGGGLYLSVTAKGARSWVYRYLSGSRLRDFGLGPLRLVPLAVARSKAIDAARLRLAGIDPIEAKRDRAKEVKIETARSVPFWEVAEDFIKSHRAGWSNVKHADQWRATLETYAKPIAGNIAVSAIDVETVLAILHPIWNTKAETAARVRGRIEQVLDFARARGQREGENPARWRGHLDKLLPARSKVATVKHHAALPWREMPEFYRELAQQNGIGAAALRFAILTAARTGEVLGAEWQETDSETKIWTVPAKRMKAGRLHRVPLAPAAIEIIEAMQKIKLDNQRHIFSGKKPDSGLSNMALLVTLRRMKRGDLTAHGFRSTFRDWAAESTNFPSEAVELALAHIIGDKVEAAYRRGDMLEKRFDLARAWAAFVTGTVSP